MGEHEAELPISGLICSHSTSFLPNLPYSITTGVVRCYWGLFSPNVRYPLAPGPSLPRPHAAGFDNLWVYVLSFVEKRRARAGSNSKAFTKYLTFVNSCAIM